MSVEPANGPSEVRLPGEIPLHTLCWGEAADIVAPSSHGVPPTIVLLHGLGDGAGIRRPMVAAWPSMHPAMPIMALDLPGHGGSGHLAAGRCRLEEVAAIMWGTLVRLSIVRPILIVHSLGAQLALNLRRAATSSLGPPSSST